MSAPAQQLEFAMDRVVVGRRSNGPIMKCGGCGRLRGDSHNCPQRSVQERFNKSVAKGEGCWPWTGAVGKVSGYGQFWLAGNKVPAHRVAYELAKGPIPAGLQIDHLCRNRVCVNPAHLEAVTHAENILRGESPAAIHARATECYKGHPLSGENLYLQPSNGKRVCRLCQLAKRRRLAAAKVAS